MLRENEPKRRYEWRITLEADGEELKSLYTGCASTESLAKLFAMWTKDRGDLSDWSDAREFAKVVNRYSSLRTWVVAVWLCLSPDDLPVPTAPEGLPVPDENNLEWEFVGPDDNPMRLERMIDG